MEKPKNQTQEVLYLLIQRNSINRKQVFFDTGILNVTARIADLRNKHFLNIECDSIKTKNKFGRNVEYGKWYLTDKEKAKETYLKLQK